MHTTSPTRTSPGMTERSPLLPPNVERRAGTASAGSADQEHARNHDENETNRRLVQLAFKLDTRPLTTIGMCLLLIITLDIGASLVSTALLQVQEDIICRDFSQQEQRRQGVSNETDCKGNDVQSELSIIQSWLVVFQLLPGLIMAVPMGLVSDRYGRSPVLGLSLFGITLSYLFSAVVCAFPFVFPLRLVWFSALFMFIGGSLTVYSTMLFCIAADISSEEQRSTAFFYLGAVLLGGAVLSNPVTYWVMETFGTWLAIYTGLCMMAATTVLGFSVPETLKQAENLSDSEGTDDAENAREPAADNAGSAIITAHLDSSTPTTESTDHNDVSQLSQPLQHFQHWVIHRLRSGSARLRIFPQTVIIVEPKAGLLLLCMLFTTFGRDAQIMLQQYVVAKFQWSWSKAGLLISIQSLVSLLLLVIILPALAQLLLRIFASHPQAKDLWLARASILVLLLGSLVIGVADSPSVLIAAVALQALGTGFNPLVRCIITNILAGSHSRDGDDGDGSGGDQTIIGLLYSVIAFIETAGTMVANPLLAVAFRAGLGWGREWIGLPFIVAAGLFGGALVIVGSVDV